MNEDGKLFAVHYRNTDQSDSAANSLARNTVGMFDPDTNSASLFYEGEPNSVYNGIKFVGNDMFLADVGQGKIRRVNLDDMSAIDFCQHTDMGTFGVPNDLAVASNGRIYLSGINLCFLASLGM